MYFFCDKCLFILDFSFCNQRDHRKRWLLPTVETEVNGSVDSKSTNERDYSLVGSLGLSCRYNWFMFCLGCSSWPSTKYLFPHRTLFQFLCPHGTAFKLGWQPCWVGCLLVLVYVYVSVCNIKKCPKSLHIYSYQKFTLQNLLLYIYRSSKYL